MSEGRGGMEREIERLGEEGRGMGREKRGEERGRA